MFSPRQTRSARQSCPFMRLRTAPLLSKPTSCPRPLSDTPRLRRTRPARTSETSTFSSTAAGLWACGLAVTKGEERSGRRFFAGSTESVPGYNNGPRLRAMFHEPGGVTELGGSLYIADTSEFSSKRSNRRFVCWAVLIAVLRWLQAWAKPGKSYGTAGPFGCRLKPAFDSLYSTFATLVSPRTSTWSSVLRKLQSTQNSELSDDGTLSPALRQTRYTFILRCADSPIRKLKHTRADGSTESRRTLTLVPDSAADNHRIARLDLKTGDVSTLKLKGFQKLGIPPQWRPPVEPPLSAELPQEPPQDSTADVIETGSGEASVCGAIR